MRTPGRKCVSILLQMRSILNRNTKISRCDSLSSDNAEFGHLTLLFCRARQRNVPRIITHVHSHFCSLNRLFGDFLVVVAAVFCVRALLSHIKTAGGLFMSYFKSFSCKYFINGTVVYYI